MEIIYVNELSYEGNELKQSHKKLNNLQRDLILISILKTERSKV